eukprot:jgi/Mesen1/888/ME000115S00014
MPGKLELVTADLNKEGSYDEAVKDCEFVCHVASPALLKSKNPQQDIVDPAVKGTQNVFNSILKACTAKKVVVTSSVTALFGERFKPNHVYTEEDWNEQRDLRQAPYPLAKTLAERTAWECAAQKLSAQKSVCMQDASWRFELVTTLPGVCFGPVLCKQHVHTSPQILQELMNGTLPMAPDLTVGVVDVRDVAKAHVDALESASAAGRYIFVHNNWSFFQVSPADCSYLTPDVPPKL